MQRSNNFQQRKIYNSSSAHKPFLVFAVMQAQLLLLGDLRGGGGGEEGGGGGGGSG